MIYILLYAVISTFSLAEVSKLQALTKELPADLIGKWKLIQSYDLKIPEYPTILQFSKDKIIPNDADGKQSHIPYKIKRNKEGTSYSVMAADFGRPLHFVLRVHKNILTMENITPSQDLEKQAPKLRTLKFTRIITK